MGTALNYPVCSVHVPPVYVPKSISVPVPVPVRHQYRYRTLRQVRYYTNSDAGHFGKFGTTSISVPDTSVSSVRHPYRHMYRCIGTVPNTPLQYSYNSNNVLITESFPPDQWHCRNVQPPWKKYHKCQHSTSKISKYSDTSLCSLQRVIYRRFYHHFFDHQRSYAFSLSETLANTRVSPNSGKTKPNLENKVIERISTLPRPNARVVKQTKEHKKSTSKKQNPIVQQSRSFKTQHYHHESPNPNKQVTSILSTYKLQNANNVPI